MSPAVRRTFGSTLRPGHGYGYMAQFGSLNLHHEIVNEFDVTDANPAVEAMSE